MPVSLQEILAAKLRQPSVMDTPPSPEWLPEYQRQEPGLEAVSPEDFVPNPKSLVAALKASPAVLGMLAGPKSKMWRPTHAAASSMELRAGAKPEDVWAYRGYGKLPEGPMATEFSDSAAKLINHPDPKLLSDILHHPELYKNYPGMKNVDFAFDTTIPGSGRHSPKVGPEGRMLLNPNNIPNDAKKLQTILHEVQHGIQSREGWTPGTVVRDSTPEARAAYKNNFGEANARLAEFRHLLSAQTLRNRYPFDPDYFKRGTGSAISDLIP